LVTGEVMVVGRGTVLASAAEDRWLGG